MDDYQEKLTLLFKKAQEQYLQDYRSRFHSSSLTGEYYGRGQLEGMASVLYHLYQELEDKSWLDPDFNAYVDVWGEEHCLFRQKKEIEED